MVRWVEQDGRRRCERCGPGVAGVEVGGSERDRGSESESVDEEIVTAVRQGR
jgi:hypothetical protein